MNPETIKKLLELGASVASDALEGREPNPHAVAKRLVSIGLDFVPVDDLRAYLSAESRARIDAEIDAEIDQPVRG